jgi:hypothetical protein
VIGAVAAIGSLVFTGVATYYGAVVAKQQLEQSQEDSERQERDHASRVTYWDESSWWVDDKERSLHLVNRSPDPVSSVHVFISGSYKDEQYFIVMQEIELPPCQELVFKATALVADLAGGEEARLADMPRWRTSWMIFTDSRGDNWVRGSTFLKKDETELGAGLATFTGEIWPSVVPQVREVEQCGATS